MNIQYVEDVLEFKKVCELIAELPKGGVYPHPKGKYMAHDHEYYENGRRIRKYVPKNQVEEMKQKTKKRRELEKYKRVLKQKIEECEIKMRADGINPEQVLRDYMENRDLESYKKWESEMNIANDYYHNNVFVTLSGFNVRSKSEVIISDQLMFAGLIHNYEEPLWIDGVMYKPDFTIHIGDEIILWEHVGLLMDDAYRARWEEKKEAYARAGYIEGKNLIVTYEHTGFDTLEVRYMIDRYIKKRW